MRQLNWEIAVICLLAVWFFISNATASVMYQKHVTTTTRYSRYISSDNLIWKRIPTKIKTLDYVQQYCGKKQFEIVEFGMIEGTTKIIRFMCEERKNAG